MGNFESRAPQSGNLDVDQALVVFQSHAANATFNVFSLSSECYQCEPKSEATLSEDQDATIQLNVKLPVQLLVGEHLNRSDAVSCGGTPAFGEFGVYNCTVGYSQDDALACKCHQLSPSARIYLPIVVWFGALAALAVTWTLLRYAYRKMFATCGTGLSAESDGEKAPSRKDRLRSVDVFRGICITIMIFVNYLGGHYWFFEHSVWNGLLPADLVFPWFVWLMGLCVPMAMRSLRRRQVARRRIVTKVIKRTVLLFVIGFVLSNIGQYDVRRLRIMGVLQRIAIAYLGVSLLCVTCSDPQDGEPRPASDLLLVLPQSLVALVLVALHLVATFMLPVPGCPTGYLGPGGAHRGGRYGNCTGGATGYIDRLVLGEGHMYASPEISAIYGATLPFDPEGILGCLQTMFLAFLGVQAGVTMLTFKKWTARVKRWLAWSVITGGAAAALCRLSKEDGWIPINKNLWSLSFVLATASLAFVVLSVCYLLVDVTKVWSGEPFFYAGMNSILMYAGHMIAYNYFPWRWTVTDGSVDLRTHEYGLVVSLWATTLWVFISFLLFRANLFLKL